MSKQPAQSSDDLPLQLIDYRMQRLQELVVERRMTKGETMKTNNEAVVEYLKSLSWDGKPHIERLAEQLQPCPGHKSPEVALQQFLVDAVCRAFSPGCAVDEVLVLVGEQGAGKSRFVQQLGHSVVSLTCPSRVREDDGGLVVQDRASGMYDLVISMSTSWIVVVDTGEAVQDKFSDHEAFKAFLTSRQDTFRPPFDRDVTTVPRTSVLVLEMCELDEKPSRRLNAVRVTQPLVFDRDQLWAEAVVKARPYL